MTSPISSNWFYYMTMASMAQAAPSINNQTNTASPLGGMANDNSLFMMILNAAMQGMQPAASEQTVQIPTQSLPQSGGSFMPFQITVQPLETPAAPAATPAATPVANPIDTKAVPTSSKDTSDFGFKPVQFIKLENTLEGKLSGTANHFINAGKKYDIDPNLLSAIAIHETGNGSSNAVHQKNNVAGMMGKNGLRSYDSVEDSIFDMARNLRKNYLNEGKDTIAKIGAKYAPVGAANDPTGLNNHWTKGVSKQFNNLA